MLSQEKQFQDKLLNLFRILCTCVDIYEWEVIPPIGVPYFNGRLRYKTCEALQLLHNRSKTLLSWLTYSWLRNSPREVPKGLYSSYCNLFFYSSKFETGSIGKTTHLDQTAFSNYITSHKYGYHHKLQNTRCPVSCKCALVERVLYISMISKQRI